VSANSYVPGTCNIGRGEVRRRQFVAIVGLALSISTLLGFIATNAPANARLAIFVPLTVTFIGWVQSRKKFCLAYGLMGTFNFGKLGDLSKVADKASKAADRKMALKILGQAVLYAAITTLVVVVLPL
jgi:hypothetical protein